MNNINEQRDYNQRHMPGGKYLKMRKINYLLYAKLQKISYRNQDEQHRYVPEEIINKTQIAKEIHSKPATIRKHLKQLEEEGLIKYVKSDDKGYYKLLVVDDYYCLVDIDLCLFKRMVKFTTDVVWRIYLVHKGEATRVKYKYGKDEYYISRDEIARRIGYSEKKLQLISEVNQFLSEDMNLISIEKEYTHENGTTKQVNKYRVLK